MLRFECRFDGRTHAKRVRAAVKSDRAKEHVRELQRVPHPFRSAHDRGAEKKLLSHPPYLEARPEAAIGRELGKESGISRNSEEYD